MVFFLGVVAFIGAAFLAMTLRREHAFKGGKQMVRPSNDEPFLVESKFRVVKHGYEQTIGIAGGRGASLRVEREGWLSRWLKWLGIGRDFVSGYPILDHHFVLESDDPRVARWLKTDTDAATEITTIFNLAPKRLIIHQGRIWVHFAGSKDKADESTAWLTQVGVALRRLAARVPSTMVGEVSENLQKSAKAMLLLALSSGMAIAAAVSATAHIAERFPIHFHPLGMYLSFLPFALSLGLLLLWFAARWIGDSARARVVLIELCTIGFASFIVLFLVSVARANIAFSSSPIMQETVAFPGAFTQRWRRGRINYRANLPELAKGAVPESVVRIGEADYAQLVNASTVKVTLQRDWFGYYFLVRSPEPVKP